jgi:hypothetical protein
MDIEMLWARHPDPPITGVAYVRDGCIEVEREGIPERFVAVVGDHDLDRYLLTKASGGMVAADAFPRGVKANTSALKEDVNAAELQLPDEEEIRLYGSDLVAQTMRRRRRRAWRRAMDYDFAERGIVAKEAIDIADLLDDGRIILVEVPETYGTKVTQMVATLALLAAVLRGHRQIRLPEHRRVPVSIWVDEAKLFLNSGIESTLTELRKAGTAMHLVLQRLAQMGPAHSPMRTAVLDTVGTVVATPMGRGEIKELSEMMELSLDDAKALERGQGVVSGLTKGWAQAKNERFNFERLAPPVQDFSSTIREQSVARFHHSVEDAERVYDERVRQIRRITAEEGEHRNYVKQQRAARSSGPKSPAGGSRRTPAGAGSARGGHDNGAAEWDGAAD